MMGKKYISNDLGSAIVLLLTWTTVIVCIDNPYRSVKRCTDQPAKTWTQSNCRHHCESKYVYTSFGQARANRRTFQSQVVSLKGKKEAPQCCCKFNDRWPDFVQAKAVDRVHNEPRKLSKSYDCYPLGLTKLALTSRTTDAYKRVCDYLDKKGPVTMLEALEFANLTAYLNMMQPKNPMILRTIGHKKMKLVDKGVLARLEEVLKDDDVFMSSSESLIEYDGYKLTTGEVRKIDNLLKYQLKEARKNGLIGKAIDEYVLSYVVVDVAAASIKVNELNKAMAIPEHLLRGDYDQYNKEHEMAAFQLKPGFDCETLYWTLNRVDIYLKAIESTLSSLNVKGAFDHMAEVNPDLMLLRQSQKIYKLLERANCRKAPNKG